MPGSLKEHPSLFEKSVSEDAINEIVDWKLELENADRLEALAYSMREGGLGTYPFGPAWAEIRRSFSGGSLWVQASSEAVVLQIFTVQRAISLETSARWDRTTAMLHTYIQIASDPHTIIMSYDVDENIYTTPNTHTRWHASHAFSDLLNRIDDEMKMPSETQQ